jgi:hypothetical protein
MGYFRELPNLEYQSFLNDTISSQSYLKVKNLFRRNKLRDDLQNNFTVFDKYEIMEGARPDTVAEELFGDSELDWVVLLTAGIINVRDEWPLSNQELYKFTENKYGFENINNIHHYETKEIKDSRNRLILNKGKVVDYNFSIKYYDDELGVYVTPTSTNDDPNNPFPNGTIHGVSNWEYETIKNEKKRSIYILRRMYLQQFLNDMRDIMIYQQSSQRIDDKLARTENTKNTMI